MTRLLKLRNFLAATALLAALTAWGRWEWNRTGETRA